MNVFSRVIHTFQCLIHSRLIAGMFSGWKCNFRNKDEVRHFSNSPALLHCYLTEIKDDFHMVNMMIVMESAK